ncbi:MAG: hypothetical protein GX207_08555 [Peptococcaceae bacterium]|nr:hypothetical protein [Peptococcaceae bacterium]
MSEEKIIRLLMEILTGLNDINKKLEKMAEQNYCIESSPRERPRYNQILESVNKEPIKNK